MGVTSLLQRLPVVRGRLTPDAPLGKVLWFGCGGRAEVLFKPHDTADLQSFLAHTPTDIPLTILGAGSNVLIRDGGIDGVVIRLGRGFSDITVTDTTITAGAAALDANVAEIAAQHGLAGLEFLSGIPGSIGGACYMNAGCYGREIKDTLITTTGLTRTGEKVIYTNEQMGFTYRHSHIPDSVFLIDATLRGIPDSIEAITARMVDIRTQRQDSQPVKGRTGGSTFTNPIPHKAWQLIDAAGCRGLTRGGAMVSDKHCNFLLNTGTATAHDLESLGEDVRRRVKNASGIELTWEIQRLGNSL